MTDPVVRQLLAAMKDRRISATDVALRAGYDRKTLTYMKQGRSSTRISTLQDFGAVLGLELTWRPRVAAVDCVDRDDGQQSTNGAL